MRLSLYVLLGVVATNGLGAISCSNSVRRGGSLGRAIPANVEAIPERPLLSSVREAVFYGDQAAQECGGRICAPGQFCCGPAACGYCAPEISSVYCPKTCGGR